MFSAGTMSIRSHMGVLPCLIYMAGCLEGKQEGGIGFI